MIRKVEHVAIICNNIDEAITYYGEVFDFVLRDRGTNPTRYMAFIYHPQQPDFEIELIQDIEPPQVPYAERSVVNHLAFTVDNLDESITYYKEKGIVFINDAPLPAIDGGRTIFFNGLSLELLQLVEPGPGRK